MVFLPLQNGLKPLQDTLSLVVSGWPVVGKSYFYPGNFKWYEDVAK